MNLRRWLRQIRAWLAWLWTAPATRRPFPRKPCPRCLVDHAWVRDGSRPWRHRCAQQLPFDPVPLCPYCRAPQPCGCGIAPPPEGDTVTVIQGRAIA